MHSYYSKDLIIKYLVILFVYVWGGVEIYQQIRQRKQRRGTLAAQDKGSLVFLYVCITLGYCIAFPVSFSPYGRLTWGNPYWLVSGVVLVALGLWIRSLAMRTLATYFTYAVEIQTQQQLVESGLYRYIRHPGYLGQLLVFLGIGLALTNWMAILGLLIPVGIGFGRRIHVEEEAMRLNFAERYESYCSRTWRLLPWLY
jgi:protein-S-isoprenylcysteine O-methyltransferase Ste14